MDERWNRLIPPSAPPAAHLGDAEFAQVELSQTADKHLADCAWCQQRRDSMSSQDREALDALLADLDARPVASQTLEAAREWSLPSALSALLVADETTWPDVAPAQLWRLSWRGEDTLAVVLERTSWWVRVAPLTTDVALADEYTLVTDKAGTSLRQPTGVFLRASATVPMFTFSRYLGDVEAVGNYSSTEALRRLETACLEQAEPPADLPTGPRLEPDDWDRLEALDALQDQMRWFETATHKVFDQDGLIVGRTEQSAGADKSVDVTELLRRDKDLRGLMESTGLAPGRLNDLKIGRIQPAPADRAALEKHFGVSVQGGYSEEARLALLEVVSEPAHRDDWSQWRDEPDTGTVEAEDRLVRFMEHLLDQPLAARSVATRSAEPPEPQTVEQWREVWRSRLAMRRRQP
jgi:hypothetical protein